MIYEWYNFGYVFASVICFKILVYIYYLHLHNYNDVVALCLHVHNNTCINMFKYTYITIKSVIYIIHIYYFRRYITLGRPPCHSVAPWPTPPRALRNSWMAPNHSTMVVTLHSGSINCILVSSLCRNYEFPSNNMFGNISQSIKRYVGCGKRLIIAQHGTDEHFKNGMLMMKICNFVLSW